VSSTALKNETASTELDFQPELHAGVDRSRSDAEPDVAETPDLSNLPCGDRRTLDGRAAVEKR
jgi:hypothetical protein